MESQELVHYDKTAAALRGLGFEIDTDRLMVLVAGRDVALEQIVETGLPAVLKGAALTINGVPWLTCWTGKHRPVAWPLADGGCPLCGPKKA